MKTRIATVTALALVALAAPTAQANIPSDHEGVSGKPTIVKHGKLLPEVRARCANRSYVPGGSSPRVALAITDAAERMGGC